MNLWDYVVGAGCLLLAVAGALACAVILFGGAWLVWQAVLG